MRAEDEGVILNQKSNYIKAGMHDWVGTQYYLNSIHNSPEIHLLKPAHSYHSVDGYNNIVNLIIYIYNSEDATSQNSTKIEE